MWETIRGYLTFTRKERFGVLFLLLVIIVLFALPYFFGPAPGDPEPAVYEKVKEAVRELDSRQKDSSHGSVAHSRYPEPKNFKPATDEASGGYTDPPKMFYFDPNNITADDWRRLGLSERLTQTILHYIDKGGRFHQAEDLKKIYGLRPGEYARLQPFVRFSQPKQDFYRQSTNSEKRSFAKDSVNNKQLFIRERPLITGTGFQRTEKRFEITDINNADSAAWSRFPGIGSILASRIVHFRERLGGFYQIDQVGETFGLPDSSFQKIKSFLRLNGASVLQLDLNEASRENLQSHPYIRWQLAKAIVDYRMQHGRFQSVDELLQLARMDQQKFEKLRPYLTLNR